MNHTRFAVSTRSSALGRRTGFRRGPRVGVALAAAVALVLLAGACSGDRSEDLEDLTGTTVTLLTHDSFYVSPETLEAFTESTGIKVEQLASGDAGVLVAQACLTAGEPLGDVLFGIDNTFLQRGLDCEHLRVIRVARTR